MVVGAVECFPLLLNIQCVLVPSHQPESKNNCPDETIKCIQLKSTQVSPGFPLAYLQRRLVGGEGDEAASVGRELPQEARGLLHVDHREVGEQVLVEAAHAVPVSAGPAGAHPPPLQAVDHVLVLDPPGLQRGAVIFHGSHRMQWECVGVLSGRIGLVVVVPNMVTRED